MVLVSWMNHQMIMKCNVCSSQTKQLKHTSILVASLVLVNRVFIQRTQISHHATTDSLLKVSGISHSCYYYIQE